MYNLMEATRSAKSIAVIGGGFLGTELAVGLAYRGKYYLFPYRLLDSLVVECWLRVREVPGSIPSQGPRHTKDVIKMVIKSSSLV